MLWAKVGIAGITAISDFSYEGKGPGNIMKNIIFIIVVVNNGNNILILIVLDNIYIFFHSSQLGWTTPRLQL